MVKWHVISRSLAACLMAILLLLGASAPASAHGPSSKGQEIGRATTIASTTGACVCDDRWYTVGLKPGVLRLTGALAHCDDPRAAACSITVFLLRGNVQVRQFGASCLKSAGPCTQGSSAQYRVSQRGAYYVLVRGGGGENVRFTLTFRGPVYALHCRKYC